MSRWFVALLVLPLLILTGCASTPTVDSGPITIISIGERKAAPELTGELLDGTGTFSLSDHGGDVVVVNFWGSWCGPCVAEADDLEQTYLSTKDSGVTFVGVNIRDDRDKAQRFAELRATYPSVFDPSSRLAIGFAIPPTATPTTIVIDRQSRIAATVFGPIQRDALEPALVSLAAENP